MMPQNTDNLNTTNKEQPYRMRIENNDTIVFRIECTETSKKWDTQYLHIGDLTELVVKEDHIYVTTVQGYESYIPLYGLEDRQQAIKFVYEDVARATRRWHQAHPRH